MKIRNRFYALVFIFLAVGSLCFAQSRFAIRNARIVTVSGATIARGTVVFSDGTIQAVGEHVSIPSRTKIIDGKGLTVYPGLFDANTDTGLTEIGAVPVTNDNSEMGEFMPHLLAFSALHVESEHIPVARVDGITEVLTRPSGGVIPGQGAIVSLAGWTPEEMEISRHGAMIVEFPSLLRSGFRGFGFSRQRTTLAQQKKEYEERTRRLSELLQRARHYAAAREKLAAEGHSAQDFTFDRQLDALVPVVEGKQPVLIQADSPIDIQNAVKFARKEKLNYAILGAREAWKVADFLKENQVRVILGPRQVLPPHEDDPQDIMYRTPAILFQKGVEFAIATGGSSDARTLPFEVGNAVGYGLPYDAAIRSITLNPARILGVDSKVGSIDKGKLANLVVTDGDILEYRTHIRYVFINGKAVSLESKHTRLYEKYSQRP